MSGRVLIGDCLERLRELPDHSIDAVVTDPPYGLSREPDIAEVLRHWIAGDDYEHTGGGFMGNSWDSFVPGPSVWREVHRVLKPGGHLLAFAGTRTVDLMAISLRLGGFQIRDQLAWMFGSGFPKSHDISKAIDREAGAEREDHGAKLDRDGKPRRHGANANRSGGIMGKVSGGERSADRIRPPATEEAAEWEGWGTALKPAYEPIILARKAPEGTLAQNVLANGTGGLNIEASRIEWGEGGDKSAERKAAGYTDEAAHALGARDADAQGFTGDPSGADSAEGRWPANVLLDEDAGRQLDGQAGEAKPRRVQGGGGQGGWWGRAGASDTAEQVGRGYGDGGGPSRFFYTPKASTAEREAGLDDREAEDVHRYGAGIGAEGQGETGGALNRNVHPTVKPIDLMRYLIVLVTPPGGTVLDPYLGSGSTGCAAELTGHDFVGCELSEEYAEIAQARMSWWAKIPPDADVAKAAATGTRERKVAETGQMGLLG